MSNIMKYCDNPMFIAHNGKQFDFPILYYFNILEYSKIKVLDSRFFIRLFINDSNISNKLIDLYNYIFKTNIKQTHRAKGDTELIIGICDKLNLSYNDLIKMCE